MLNTQEKKARLTNLLSRIENNRPRMGQRRATVSTATAAAPVAASNLAEELEDAEAFPTSTASQPALSPAKPPVAPLVEAPTSGHDEHDDDDIDFGLAEPHEAVDASAPVEVTEPIPSLPPEPEPPAADSIAGALDSVIPEAAETTEAADATAAPSETKKFQATPSATGDAVAISGQRPPVSWSIESVLNRAWKVGAR